MDSSIKGFTPKRDLSIATSDSGALFHIVKGCLGAGLLAMPFAFKSAGWLLGLIGCCITGVIVTHTTALLINGSQTLCEIYGKSCLTYAQTAEHAIIYGFSGKYKKYAYILRYVVDTLAFLAYYFLIIGYIIIMADTAKQILEDYSDIILHRRTYILLMIFLVFPIGIVKHLKFLVPFSILANTIQIISICLIFHVLLTDLPPLNTRVAVQDIEKWPLFFCTSFLSMEGICVIIVVENEMKNPRKVTHYPGFLYIAMITISILSVAMGFLGYLKYGDKVEGSIPLNLANDWFSQVIKVSTATSLWFSYGLALTVCFKIAWSTLERSFRTFLAVKLPTTIKEPVPSAATSSDCNVKYFLIKSAMMILSVATAAVLPSISGIISLIGAIGLSMLGIVIPVLIEIFVKSGNHGFLKWRLIKNVFLMVAALFLGCFGTYSSIIEMYENINK